jgi:hypothetical protein
MKHTKNDNSIFIREQFGFRKNLTTKKAIYELINEIVSAPNGKLIVGGVFCDLAKVLVCVHHYILLSRLNFYRITGKAYEWMKSYLRNRFQRVEIVNKNFNHNTFLDWGVIKHGVPQGSILGPLLFLFYVNDLSKTLNGKPKPVLFGDGTRIIFTDSNFEDFKSDIRLNLSN